MPRPTGTSLAVAGAGIALLENAFPDPDHLYRRVDAEADWRHKDITLFGRTHKMPRLVCWMGERPYTYSGLTHAPVPFSPSVTEIRVAVERISGARFNGVLLNLYRDGADSMGWHADDEASLGPDPVIASVSLGAVRRMRFKPKPHFKAETFGLNLPSGSLLLMKGPTQANWLHAVPKTARRVGPRINLTFRNIVEPD